MKVKNEKTENDVLCYTVSRKTAFILQETPENHKESRLFLCH